MVGGDLKTDVGYREAFLKKGLTITGGWRFATTTEYGAEILDVTLPVAWVVGG